MWWWLWGWGHHEQQELSSSWKGHEQQWANLAPCTMKPHLCAWNGRMNVMKDEISTKDHRNRCAPVDYADSILAHGLISTIFFYAFLKNIILVDFRFINKWAWKGAHLLVPACTLMAALVNFMSSKRFDRQGKIIGLITAWSSKAGFYDANTPLLALFVNGKSTYV